MPNTATTYIIIFSMGALFLAAIYHTILYFNKRDFVISSYCFYLWSVALYILYRMVCWGGAEPYCYDYFPSLDVVLCVDSSLMWVSFFFYAMFLKKVMQNARNVKFFNFILWVIVLNTVWENIVPNIDIGKLANGVAASVRIFLSIFSFWVIVSNLKQKTRYYYFIAAGNFSLIFFSLLSVIFQFSNDIKWGVNTWGWMMFGYFFDVIFFSAAIGYRSKEESVERLSALQQVIDQQGEIKRLELDKIKAVYETREQERNRISSDLHDDLGGGLSTIKLMVEMMQRSGNLSGPDCLKRIVLKLKDLVQNMNEIVWSLNTSSDSLPGTIAYIRQYAYQFLEDTPITLVVTQQSMPQDIEMNGMVRRQLFLLVKESLHNIVKHAEATLVSIEFFYNDGIAVLVTDNGKGISSECATGNGLNNMKSRISKLNGELEINSVSGTSVFFAIPSSSFYNQSAIPDFISID